MNKKEAEELLIWARNKNPGKWVGHSYNVAKIAEKIAKKCSLESDSAYILGLLHDIGRYEGVTGLRHTLAGYNLMIEKGYTDIAKICLTHSFPYKVLESYQGEIDCNDSEINYIKNELEKIEYNEYDKLIQLCDAMGLSDGVTIIEVRIVDIVKRYGYNKYTIDKWNSIFEIKKFFDEKCKINIYELFDEEIMKKIIS